MFKKIIKAGVELIIGAVLIAGAIWYYHHVMAKAVKAKRISGYISRTISSQN